jgi:hypothetical protein
MAQESLQDIVAFLSSMPRYRGLIARYERAPEDHSLWFELSFAYWLERDGYPLRYEVPVNPKNQTSVDFELTRGERRLLFELTRVERSDEIQAHIDAQTHNDAPLQVYDVLLSSDHQDPYFKTAAQAIRLQEKILEKISKFPDPTANTTSFIVVDCSTTHEGMLDGADVEIVMYGRCHNPLFQEYWNGNRLVGMYEPTYSRRNSDEFKKKIDGILFLPELKPAGLKEAFVTLNPTCGSERRQKAFSDIKHVSTFGDLRAVLPAPQ